MAWSMTTGDAIAAPAAARPLKAGAAAIAYVVSQHSPLLNQSEKTAISQDFNGAPLAAKPRMHNVQANALSCRARNDAGHTAPNCTLCPAPFEMVLPEVWF